MADEDLKSRFMGKSPGRTIIQLVVASIFVGAALALFDISPLNFWRGIFDGCGGRSPMPSASARSSAILRPTSSSARRSSFRSG